MKRLSEQTRLRQAIGVTECRRRTKAKAVAYKGGKCSRCGLVSLPAVYDFHHTDPHQKEFGLSRLVMSFEKMRKELDKTVLLCANCHRLVHEELFAQTLASRKAMLDSIKDDPDTLLPRGRPCVVPWLSDDELVARVNATSWEVVQNELGCSKSALGRRLQAIRRRHSGMVNMRD